MLAPNLGLSVDRQRLRIGRAFIFLTGCVIIGFGIPIALSHPEYHDPAWLRLCVGGFMILGILLYGRKSIQNMDRFWIWSIPVFPGWSLLMLEWNHFAPRYMITAYLIILGYSAMARDKKSLTLFLLGYLSSVLLLAYNTPHTETPLGDLVPTLIFAAAVIYTLCLALIFLRDAYIRKEAEIIGQFRQLAHAHTQVQQARDQAEEALLAKSRFLSALSHELRTPLNAVVGFADLLVPETRNLPSQDSVEGIRTASTAMLFHVDSLLAYISLENGKWQGRNDSLDLKVFCQKICEESALLLDADPSRIEFSWPEELATRRSFDPFHLGFVLKHLLTNALKFSESKVRFVVSGSATELAFEVLDQGIGIDPDRIPELGGLLVQLDQGSRRKHGGLGIGLALVRKTLAQWDSELTIQSRPKHGSRFVFTLLSAACASVPVEQTPSPSHRILLVEDNPINAKIARRYLEKWGKEVTWAVNGAEGVRTVVDQGPFDAILMDMHMPVMDGIEATLAIRALDNPQLSEQKIIVLTASVTGDSAARLKDVPLQGFLTKPIDANLLRDALQ